VKYVYRLFVTEGTGRFFFRIYSAPGQEEGTYGRHFGWATREEAEEAALARVRVLAETTGY
jgi:hypothetical protein